MTGEEITKLTDERQRLGMMWAGPALISTELQKPGLVEAKVHMGDPCCIPLPEVKKMFPITEAATLAVYLKSEAGAGVNFLLEGLENPNVVDETFAQLLGYLATVAGVCSMDSVLAILDLGKRLQTRSEELFGRQLTIAEITEGFNG